MWVVVAQAFTAADPQTARDRATDRPVVCSADLRCLQVCGFKANGPTEAKIQGHDATRCSGAWASERDSYPLRAMAGASNCGWLCPNAFTAADPQTARDRATDRPVVCTADLRCLQVCGFKANGPTEAKNQGHDATRCWGTHASERAVLPAACHGGASNCGWWCLRHLLPRTRKQRGTALQVGNHTRRKPASVALAFSAAGSHRRSTTLRPPPPDKETRNNTEPQALLGLTKARIPGERVA